MKIKKIKGLLILIMVVLIIPVNSFAAVGSFSISASSKSITTGQTSTITITATNCEGQFTIVSSDTSVVTVSTSSVWIDSSTSVTLSAKKAGIATITITATDVGDSDENEVTGSRTCSVTVSDSVTTPTTPTTPVATTKSSDSKLKALAVAQGTITPEFSTNVKEYALSVTNDITELSVAVTPNSSKATYSVNGNKDLKEGENTVTVIVKAENGTTSTYTIKVTRAKPELALSSLNVKYKDNDKKDVELKVIPDFLATTYEYTLPDIEYYVKKLDIEAIANREEAIVAIVGNKELKEGKNKIEISLKIPAQEGIEEQTKTYTITVNKKTEPIPPTTYEKIVSWISTNKMMVVIISLAVCVALLITLSIYIIIDNFKYKKLVKELKAKNGESIEENNSKKTDKEKKENIEDEDNKKEVEEKLKLEEKKEEEPKN